MKNKEIALRVGTTEQVVKNYLRKVYDKLGVADRLELALYCLNHRVLEGAVLAKVAQPVQPTNDCAPASKQRPTPQPLLPDPAPDSSVLVQFSVTDGPYTEFAVNGSPFSYSEILAAPLLRTGS
jgi:hypothetical protein